MTNHPEETEVIREAHARGFILADTGGGCQAFLMNFPDGQYVMVTDCDGSHIPVTMDEPAMTVFYDDQDESLLMNDIWSVRQAFREIRKVQRVKETKNKLLNGGKSD